MKLSDRKAEAVFSSIPSFSACRRSRYAGVISGSDGRVKPRTQGGSSVAKPSETTPKPPGFALQATPLSPHAIHPLASARGILAKASNNIDIENL